ncbi:MAG: PIN domain-containing protein [Desulfurococcales archaeon]|nr:PIN domain-containing protein [Desulfurococcales archaeon]
MIIDTTYLLPLIGVSIDKDLLKAIVERRTRIDIDIDDLAVSLISLFELQAKAVTLNISSQNLAKAIEILNSSIRVIPFYNREVIEYSYEVYKLLRDYIDSIIVATAISLREDLATEDRVILSIKKDLEKTYEIKIYSYKDLVIK